MTLIVRISKTRWLRQVMLHTATVYFAKKLKGFQCKRVHVKIDLVHDLRSSGAGKYRGLAHQSSPHGFVIKLEAALKPLTLLRVLAHEMIHLNQWLTGKMEDLDGYRNSVRWGKRVYSSHAAYAKHPWEIEAHRHEKQLAQSFIEFWTKR